MGAYLRIRGCLSCSPELESTVDDLIIDSANGKIALLILSDIEGRGDHRVAVPFNILNRTGKGAFALSIMGDDLASAPSFHASDLHASGYFGEVYRFFGLQPRRTEETAQDFQKQKTVIGEQERLERSERNE